MQNSSLFYKILFCMLPGCGPITGHALLTRFKEPDLMLKNNGELLAHDPEVPASLVAGARDPDLRARAQREMNFISEKGIRPLWITDQDYPYRLRECADAPLLLYWQGETLPSRQKMIAVVGTRRASRWGADACQKLITGLARLGFSFGVVSGLASGIDTYAHSAALDCGMPTYAILGHGLQEIFPAGNHQLAQKICQTGSLLTEFASSDPFSKGNFVRRNRIIAGLSDAVIVVESGIKGGAMRTAAMGHSYNRELFAVPGRPTDYFSKGCNLLIKQEMARLVETAEDVAAALNWDLPTTQRNRSQPELPFIEALPPAEQKVIALFEKSHTLHIDQITEYLEFPIQKTAEILMKLVIKGRLRSLPGQSYQL